MHEVSLVQSLIRQVEAIVADEGGGEVSEVRVSIGPLSGVEPMLVQIAFDNNAPESTLAGAVLNIDCPDLEAICRVCGESFVVVSFSFQCPACQSRSVQITGGDEFRLISISVEQSNASSLNEASAADE